MSEQILAALRGPLAQPLAEARAAWPGVTVPEAELAAHLARHGELEQVALRDVYLAAGLAAGLPAALAAFEKSFAPELVAALRRLRLSDGEVEELMQSLRERLFVGVPPRIAGYAGRGSLAGWLRAAAVRHGLNHLESRKASVPLEEELLGGLPGTRDPELASLRADAREAFRAAFASAVGQLEPRERALLGQHFVDGLGIDALATIYGVHRATCARWLAAARQALLAATHGELAERLGASATEVESLVRVLGSDLELSLHRVLSPDSKPG